jgi:oxaloacetate decarboxylase gamma subunit
MEAGLMAGFELAGLGMGVVFSFLTLLVLMTSMMSSVLMRWSPAVTGSGHVDDAEDRTQQRRLQAVAIAVQKYRQQHRR